MAFSLEFIEHQKQLLNAMLERLTGAVQSDVIQASGTGDFADVSSEITEIEQSLSANANRFQIVRDIKLALQKIKNGVYGICEMSGEDIGVERLQAIPWARFTVTAQSSLEKSGRSPNSIRAPLFDSAISDDSSPEEGEEGEHEAEKVVTKGRGAAKK